MMRITAIVGAIVVFAGISIVLGLIVNRMFDGEDVAQICGAIAVEIFAIAASFSSYRATMRRGKKRVPSGS
jgi:divalent metal cation (Fe/Co/Zn/Cd) transporter